MEVLLSLTPINTTATGTLNLDIREGGVYFTNIFFGESPEASTLTVLSGGSNVFSSIEFQNGCSFYLGSILIGSIAPSGVIQTFSIEHREVIDVHTVPELKDDNVEDFS